MRGISAVKFTQWLGARRIGFLWIFHADCLPDRTRETNHYAFRGRDPLLVRAPVNSHRCGSRLGQMQSSSQRVAWSGVLRPTWAKSTVVRVL